jgi:hypothetical protein
MVMGEAFSHIRNMSVMTGVFPDRMKYAVIKPFFKKGVKEGITNYRPISLLIIFSKVLEKTI